MKPIAIKGLHARIVGWFGLYVSATGKGQAALPGIEVASTIGADARKDPKP